MDILQLHKLFLNSTGITTDTRKVAHGNIFFALKGDNFDGNFFAEKAISDGALYAVVDNSDIVIDDRFILVDDVLITLQNLAAFHRNYLNIPILAITGTNGKTTTKELVREVLMQKYNVNATQGNLNNHIGVPITLLSFDKDVEIGIVEMGANHIGEIAHLCEIAQPDFGLITNIGKAHIEGFGSYEGVITAKSELYHYLNDNLGKVFFNQQDVILGKTLEKLNVKTIPYCSVNTVSGNLFAQIEWEESVVKSNLVGNYNVDNITAAITIGNYFEVEKQSIVEAIENYIPTNNRSQLIEKGELSIIIDAYNANPSSMNVALNNLASLKSISKVAILGDMLELGDVSFEEHQTIVDKAVDFGFDKIIFVGSNFLQHKNVSKKGVEFFANFDELKNSNNIEIPSPSTVLIKGSRGIGLERVLDLITK